MWESAWRLPAAWVMALLGLWLIGVGTRLAWQSLWALNPDARTTWSLMHGIRRVTQGLALFGIALGWAMQWPVAVAAGVLFGFEESIETGIAGWALRRDVPAIPGCKEDDDGQPATP